MTQTIGKFEPQALLQPEPETSTRSLRALAIHGSIWILAGHGISQVLRLGGNLALAWLLFPKAFGMMALVNILMQGLKMFSDIGIQPSIVQNERGNDQVFLNTAWTIQVGRGLILWLVACLLAWPFAAIYDEPQLLQFIPVAGLTVLIGGFNSTSIATASRHLAIDRLTKLEIVVQVVSISVMIVGALLWRSVWALVVGGLVGTSLRLLLSHTWLAEHQNRFGWDREAARSLVRFGKWIFLSTAMTFLVLQADRLLLGKLVPLDVLGVYSVALVLMKLPKDLGLRLTRQVLFPVLSRQNRIDPNTLPEKIRLARSMILSVGVFVFLGVALLAPSFFRLLYDERYHDAGWIAQLLAIPVWFSLLRSTGSPALLALGDSRSVAMSTIVNLLTTVTGCLVGFYLYDLVGFVLGIAVGSLVGHVAIELALARRGILIYGQDIVFTCLAGGLTAIGLVLRHFIGSYKIVASEPLGDLIAAGLVLTIAGCFAATSIHRSLTVGRASKGYGTLC